MFLFQPKLTSSSGGSEYHTAHNEDVLLSANLAFHTSTATVTQSPNKLATAAQLATNASSYMNSKFSVSAATPDLTALATYAEDAAS